MTETVAGYDALDEHRSRYTHVYARLADGASFESAEAELEPFFDAYERRDLERGDMPTLTAEARNGFLGSRLRVLEGGRGQARLGEALTEPVLILGGATLLAVIGLYGVLSFSAQRRFHEVGVRMALGAPRWSAAGLIVREALGLAVAGLGIALPVAWGLATLARKVGGADPLAALRAE